LHPNFKESVEQYYIDKIHAIGIPFFETLFNDCVELEHKYAYTHFVFYHGQKREFLLFQDMTTALYKILLNKSLKDFIMLRIPDADFSKFNNVREFIDKYKHEMYSQCDFDHQKHVNKILLAVNPSLFNNSYFQGGECTFDFFIRSDNIHGMDHVELIRNLFTYFNILHVFEKYKKSFQELIKLLSAYEKTKTGILIQIFIPKTYTDQIAYRCRPFGVEYHENHDLNPASQDLQMYQDNMFGLFHSHYDVDEMQLRLLINDHCLLNVNQPKHIDHRIFMFRYMNETKNIKTYKTKLKKVISALKKDLQPTYSLMAG
jgi:hypothetical protein